MQKQLIGKNISEKFLSLSFNSKFVWLERHTHVPSLVPV